MGLRMTSPKRPPQSRNYSIRKRVPEELQPILGKRELKKSLGTSDPKEARRLTPIVCAEFDKILTDARRSLTMGSTEVQALKGEYLRERVEVIIREAQRNQWQPEDFDTQTLLLSDNLEANIPPHLDEKEYEEWRSAHASQQGQQTAQKLLKRHSLTPTTPIAQRLGLEVIKAEYDAYRAAYAKLYGDPDYTLPSYASIQFEDTSTLPELFAQYAKSEKLPAKTVDSWREYIRRADRYFKGNAASRLTDQDIWSFAEALRSGNKDANPKGKELTTKTVNDNYIAALSAVYKWAIKRKKLTTDPTKGVRLKSRGAETLRIEGYTREQVATILRATRQPQSTRTKPETANLRRWVPWLCAFTGARISEILWLKRKDVGFTDGVAFVSIYPDTDGGARSTKNVDSIRHTPLHPAIIEEGFLDYWRSLPDTEEHLFPGDWEDKNGDRAKTPANRLRDWLKSTALPGASWERLSPNHSFRHWLIGECRRAKVDPDHAKVITGHKAKDVHGRYDPADTPELYEALKAIPSPLDP